MPGTSMKELVAASILRWWQLSLFLLSVQHHPSLRWGVYDFTLFPLPSGRAGVVDCLGWRKVICEPQNTLGGSIENALVKKNVAHKIPVRAGIERLTNEVVGSLRSGRTQAAKQATSAYPSAACRFGISSVG
jgi:hypothetical protein